VSNAPVLYSMPSITAITTKWGASEAWVVSIVSQLPTVLIALFQRAIPDECVWGYHAMVIFNHQWQSAMWNFERFWSKTARRETSWLTLC